MTLPAVPPSLPAHTAPVLPVLYSFRRCPYAMRARMAIAVSGVPCELREIVLRDKPQAMLRASPKGTVPVLIDTSGTVFDQSLDIMLWALRQNDPQHWLCPAPVGGVDTDAAGASGESPNETLAAMLALVDQCDVLFKPHLDRYKYPQRYDNAEAPEAHRQHALDWLLRLEARLGASAWLFASHPVLADMAIAPFVRQYASVDEAWFQAQPVPGVQRWLADFLTLPAFKQAMQKYVVWTEGRAGVVFPA